MATNITTTKQNSVPAPAPVPKNVYSATAEAAADLLRSFPFYSEVMDSFREGGAGSIELRRRYMLKALDKVWVDIIEDTLPALDTIIRNPMPLLQEQEKVLAIEQTRRVTSRSIQHLCQHTDYINEIRDDGTVMPSKLLNVFQDETILTYENKFINTLIVRLYAFVARRYEAAEAAGEDEKTTKLDFSQAFQREGQTGKIHLTIEVSEQPRDNEVVQNYIYTTDLWRRVQKIYHIVTKYMDSPFVAQMGKAYVHPPIMRTNKILKNVDFHQCMTLWEFLDQYENTGYETLVQEDLERLDEKAVKEFYDTLAMQYVLFQSSVQNRFCPNQALAVSEPNRVLHPKFVDELDELDEREFDLSSQIPFTEDLTDDERIVEQALRIALEADKYYMGEEADFEEEVAFADSGAITYRYRYSFLARLVRAQDPAQRYYTEIKNRLLSYNQVKSRISWNHELFTLGRPKCARINVRGKTVYLYLDLNPGAYQVSKYHHVDLRVEKEKEDLDLPFLLKVRSDRGLKYALELIDDVMAQHGLTQNPSYVAQDFHMPYETNEEMAKHVPPLVKILNETPVTAPAAPAAPATPAVPVVEEAPTHFSYSFLARLTMAQEPVQSFYTDVKNALLSYRKMRESLSWGRELFIAGRRKCACINVRGKTLYLFLALDPAQYAVGKYHHTDLNQKKPGTELPFLLKVRSPRACKYALELIADMAASLELQPTVSPASEDYRRPLATAEEMAQMTPPLVKTVKAGKFLTSKHPNADTTEKH